MHKFMCLLIDSKNAVTMTLSEATQSDTWHSSCFWKQWNRCICFNHWGLMNDYIFVLSSYLFIYSFIFQTLCLKWSWIEICLWHHRHDFSKQMLFITLTFIKNNFLCHCEAFTLYSSATMRQLFLLFFRLTFIPWSKKWQGNSVIAGWCNVLKIIH